MGEGRAREIMQYSFLRVFANDRTIDANELEFMKRLALRDGVLDDAEQQMLEVIFSRVTKETIAPDVWAEIEAFKLRYFR